MQLSVCVSARKKMFRQIRPRDTRLDLQTLGDQATDRQTNKRTSDKPFKKFVGVSLSAQKLVCCFLGSASRGMADGNITSRTLQVLLSKPPRWPSG